MTRRLNYSSTKTSELFRQSRLGVDARENKELERMVSDIPKDSAKNTNEIEMLDAKETWSVYRLADGTTLRIKPVMIAVFRADGQHTPEGEPVYNMKSTLITDVRAPASPTKTN
jgi:hypothetical protein